jgi:hypothetical protein
LLPQPLPLAGQLFTCFLLIPVDKLLAVPVLCPYFLSPNQYFSAAAGKLQVGQLSLLDVPAPGTGFLEFLVGELVPALGLGEGECLHL